MIDTPQSCQINADISRSAANGPMLENVRSKHLASAAAWEGLAYILREKAMNRPASSGQMTPAPLFAAPAEFRSLEGWENEGGGLTA